MLLPKQKTCIVIGINHPRVYLIVVLEIEPF